MVGQLTADGLCPWHGHVGTPEGRTHAYEMGQGG